MNIRNSSEYRDIFISLFKDNAIIPIVGSGISVGTIASRGTVPSGNDYRKYMIKTLKDSGQLSEQEVEMLEKERFSNVAMLYENDELVSDEVRKKYYRDNFSDAIYAKDDVRRDFFKIGWPYIYSLNIDDAIEKSTVYNSVVLPSREFNDDIFDNSKCVLKLHGDIDEILKYKDSYKVFTSKEYSGSLSTNRPMLNKLASDYGNVNVLFIGCSLDDEVDLLALDALNLSSFSHASSNNAGVLKRNFIFLTQEPGIIDKAKYQNYGVTDIVLFENYNSMYSFLLDAWDRSQSINKDELEYYSSFKPLYLRSEDESNKDYLYMAMNLVDYSSNTITYPYFLVARDCTRELIDKTKSNTILILSAQRFSGKSYLLAEIYKDITDRPKYLFDARTRLSDESLTALFEKKNSFLMFDTDSLTKDQLEIVMVNKWYMQKNNIGALIILHSRDTESKGLMQLLIEKGIVSQNDYLYIDDVISNKLSKKELTRINQKLPEARLQPYVKEDTFINYLISISGEKSVRTKYSERVIPSNDLREIAFSIALASYEALYFSDIVNLEFENIIGAIINECSPMIEAVPTKVVEKSAKDMSGVKYVLNSKYWIRKGLLHLAERGESDKIVDAYKYLIERLIDFSKEDLNRRRNKYKKLIYFDTINDIFGGTNGGKRELVAKIYSSLNDLLGTDYQYNHQRAKCLMRNAYYQTSAKAKELSYEDALESALIASKQVNNEYGNSHSDKLLISLAHIDYTLASISASICNLHEYKDSREIEVVIERCYRAVISPYNEDDFYQERKRKLKYGINEFVKKVLKLHKNEDITNDYRDMFNELVNRTLRLT